MWCACAWPASVATLASYAPQLLDRVCTSGPYKQTALHAAAGFGRLNVVVTVARRAPYLALQKDRGGTRWWWWAPVLYSFIHSFIHSFVIGFLPRDDARLAERGSIEQYLLRVEASLLYPWWPAVECHCLYSDDLKRAIVAFRVACWYLAARVEGSGGMMAAPTCAVNTLPWVILSCVMPHIGLGWMAERWLPDQPASIALNLSVDVTSRLPSEYWWR
jgi:hypothetical protein